MCFAIYFSHLHRRCTSNINKASLVSLCQAHQKGFMLVKERVRHLVHWCQEIGPSHVFISQMSGDSRSVRFVAQVWPFASSKRSRSGKDGAAGRWSEVSCGSQMNRWSWKVKENHGQRPLRYGSALAGEFLIMSFSCSSFVLQGWSWHARKKRALFQHVDLQVHHSRTPGHALSNCTIDANCQCTWW